MDPRFRLVAAWLSAALWAALAQTPTGEIRGRVVDASSAVIAGAKVEVTNLETNVVIPTTTNTEGNFLVRNLNPGAFRLTVARAGFKTYSRQPLQVRVGDVLNLEVPLEVGAVSDTVTVTAETPLLETANATVGQVVDTRRIQDLPTPGNSAIYQLQFVPGASTTTAVTNLWPPDALGSGSSTSIGGGRPGANEFALDGTPMMTRAGGFTLNPPQEMVQEVRVTTAAYDASLGRFLGGHVNMVMRSGTNTLHGSMVYQNLSRGMIAKDLFTSNAINDPKTGPVTPEKIERNWPPQRVLRLQGNMGGPLYLPGIYNGRSRTFWTFGGDGVDRQRAARASYTVPTAEQRLGDFSALLRLGSQYQIYDPATITPIAGGRYSRLPLAGNLVPASRINALSKKLLEYYPLPNATGSPDGTNNYTDPNMADSPYKGYLGRVDHTVNERHRFFVSFNMAYTDPQSDRYFHNDATGTIRERRQRGLTFEHTWVPAASTILNFRYGLNRFRDDTAPPSLGFDLAALGINSALVSRLDSSLTTLPQLTITGNTGIGGGSGSRPRTTYHNLIAQGTHVRGNHTVRFGIESRLMFENNWSLGNISPAMQFTQTWTRGPLDNSAAAPIGQGLASFLLGLPTGGSISRNASVAEASQYWGLFAQDDWKIGRRLTVNIGLRWDYDTPTTERYNRATRGFAYGTPSPVEAAARANYALSPIPEIPAAQFRVTGGLLFAGRDGAPRGYVDPDRNNFSPRIGFAYQLTPRTALRGGYGIFFSPFGSDQFDASQPGFSQTTPLVASLDNGVTFRASMANPFPDGLLEPQGAAQGLATYLGQGISVVNPGLHDAYTQRWGFNVQRELPARFLADIGYMGNRSTGLAVSRALSALPNHYLSTRPVRDDATISYLTAQVRNPFATIAQFAGTALQSTNVQRQQLLSAYPHYTSVGAAANDGYAWYHALQARVERRFAAGYTLQASYTFSKNMEAVSYLNGGDARPHEVVAAIDQTHVLAMTGVYELPFGKGRRFANSNRWLDLAVGGWALNGVWQVQSGRPLEWGNILFTGNIKDIALPHSQRTPNRWFNVDAGFNRNSAQQLASNLRTFPLRLNGVRAPGVNITNLSLFKDFKIAERVRLQFRAEAVDALNETPLSTPNVSPTSGSFGTITTVGAGNTQRRITLGGKISW
ncbi:MAG: TonB-dependent receptor domain-containing protein [Bryobacteraceae bacterium]